MRSPVVYIGLRGAQHGHGHGHGGPSVVGVHRDGERTNLELDDARVVEGAFEWGYEGAGPRRLAQAILNDFLAFEVDQIAANTFLRDVVSKLPGEFDLTGEEIASWINDRLVMSSAAERGLR